MFTRTGPVIRKMTGITNEKKVVNRCYELGLWNRKDRSVVLGPLNAEYGDLEFWMIAMAANGQIHRHPNGTFQSLESLNTAVQLG